MWFKDRLKEEAVKVSDDEFDRYASYLMGLVKDFNKCNESLELVKDVAEIRIKEKEDDAMEKFDKDIDFMSSSIDNLIGAVMNDEEF